MIKKIVIWSKWLRIIHGVFILSFFTLVVSGWLLIQNVQGFSSLLITHQVASTFIGVFLLIRIVLLAIGKGAESIKSFFDQGMKLQKVNELLAFYFTLGKRPLPNWHSKPALWSFIYLVMFVLMILSLITGVLQTQQDMFFKWVLHDLHLLITETLLWTVLLHIITSILHDAKSENANISAMINGQRYLTIEERSNKEVPIKFKL